MKSVYLIMYLWNAAAGCTNGSCAHAAGGPALQVVAMPSLTACEAVGASAKQMIDAVRPEPTADNRAMYSHPTSFRCVEVSK